MDIEIFENDKEKAEARQALTDLMDHPGYKFLVKALDGNIKYFTEQLRTRQDFQNVQQVYRLQDRLDDLESFKTLPTNLLIEAKQDVPEEEDPDPFGTPDDILPEPNNPD